MTVRKYRLGDLVVRRRGELRYSQETLAEKASVDIKTLQGIETGFTRRPRAATLGKLASALDIDIKYLFEELLEAEKSSPTQSVAYGHSNSTHQTNIVEFNSVNATAEPRARFGVFLSEFSYTQGLLTPDDFILNIEPESAARIVCQDIMKLLLIFDVVHIPLGQYIFLPSAFYKRVASILLNDKDIRSLASNGFISVTFPQSSRGAAIEQYVADHYRFNWKFSELLDRNDLDAIMTFPEGFNFDHDKAENLASQFLLSRLSDCRSILPSASNRFIHAIHSTIGDNSGHFIMESFLPRLLKIDVPRDEYYRMLKLAHKAYYINPNHLSASQYRKSKINFFSYESDIDRHSLRMPINSTVPIRYLFSPEYLVELLSNWITIEDWSAYFLSAPRTIRKIRDDARWHEFVLYYQNTVVLDQSKYLRLHYMLHSLSESQLDASSQTAARVLPGRANKCDDVIMELKSISKFGGDVPLMLKSPLIRSAADNLWRHPSLQEFIKVFRSTLNEHNVGKTY